MEKLTQEQREYQQILYMIQNEGVIERVFQADSTWTDEQKVLKNNYENNLYMPILIRYFHKFQDKNKRLPTQNEYVDAYLKHSFKHLKNKKWYDDKHKEFITNCIIWRADRAYKSNLIEIITAKQLEMLGYTVFRHRYIDIVMGVDLIAVKDNKYWCLHITKNSKWAKDKIFAKGSYTDYTINHKLIMYRRNFKRHVRLLYDCENGYNNHVANGLPIFDNDYLIEKLDDYYSFDWDSEDNQLLYLIERLKGRKAESESFEFVSTDKKLIIK